MNKIVDTIKFPFVWWDTNVVIRIADFLTKILWQTSNRFIRFFVLAFLALITFVLLRTLDHLVFGDTAWALPLYAVHGWTTSSVIGKVKSPKDDA